MEVLDVDAADMLLEETLEEVLMDVLALDAVFVAEDKLIGTLVLELEEAVVDWVALLDTVVVAAFTTETVEVGEDEAERDEDEAAAEEEEEETVEAADEEVVVDEDVRVV